MGSIINRDDTPSHLFNIPELDFTQDLFTERISGPWFRLGAWTETPRRDGRDVADVVSRQSLLIAPEQFSEVFDKLESIGNIIHDLGKPHGSVLHETEQKKYKYRPFHEFEFPFAATVGEPLVFNDPRISGSRLLINPDLWLFFELEEKTPGKGIWWDPRRGVEALIQDTINQGNLEVVEVRTDYLRKYLQARQMSLIIGHYRHLHLFGPTDSAIRAFVKEDVVMGSPEQGVKAIIHNWGLQEDLGTQPFLQRRLHLWFEIAPPEIDIDDPWTEQPSFDAYAFTLPTRVGPVAPARWKHFGPDDGRSFEGEGCHPMDRVYFRQEVLTKYEGAAGFDVKDHGSVSCRHYWGLAGSTERLGNELLATTIVDFAEGVPFEEWPHWKQYAVEPPSSETAQVLRQEQSVADAVNSLVRALEALNTSFRCMAASIPVMMSKPLWCGSLDSLAGRQLKWVYPATADDDEFLKRATLASTLVIEGLKPASLRQLLVALGGNLDKTDEDPPRPLSSRNLLQRLTLVADLAVDFRSDVRGLPILVEQAEGKTSSEVDPDLQLELETVYKRVRELFAPLAFLYDLRTHGGLAHTPNKEHAAEAAAQLGLPEKNWHRTDYLRLLNLISESVRQISKKLDKAGQVMAGDGLTAG